MNASRDGEQKLSFAEMMADEREREGFRQYLIKNEAQCEDFIQRMISGAIGQLEAEPPQRELAENGMAWAEWAANQARHWVDIAKCYSREFRNHRRTGGCILRANQIAMESPMVPTVESLTGEADVSGDEGRHIEYRMVPSPVFIKVIGAEFMAPLYSSMLRDMIKNAEDLSDKYANLPAISPKRRTRRKAAQDLDNAFLDHYGKAESQLGWLFIAKFWSDNLDDQEEALRCLNMAEDLAAEMATIAGWVEVAKLWMRVLEEPEEARRCVAEAEKLPDRDTAKDYTSLAQGIALIGQTELAVKYLDKAESLAIEPSERSAIASVWKGLGYHDRAEKVDRMGESSYSRESDGEPAIYRDSKGPYVSGKEAH